MTNPEATVEAPLKLEDILQFELPALFRRQHLNRDIIIGLIGDIGAGKSIGGGVIVLLDYMLQGEPCFSNMRLKATLNVDDEIAGQYGLKSGEATFEAKPLDKRKFLRFDSEYRGGVFFTHEFNIWLADARRSTSNLNLETNDVAQELRKLQSAWIYDCLHEMFVDMRVRDATDIFIQTSDTALTPRGMASKQKQGIEFEWWITPITQKGAAIMGAAKGTRIGPRYMPGKQFWGLIDTNKKERREKYKTQIGDTVVDMEMVKSPEMVAAESRWGWLYKAIKELHDAGYEEIHNEELWDYLRLNERGISPAEAGRQISAMGVRKRQAPPSIGGAYYLIDKYDLKKGVYKERKEAIFSSG